jgi:predicted nuclease of predicted toxin-antitoxin system
MTPAQRAGARLKLLLDQGLPRGARSLLQQRGYDVVHTGEIGLATATDEDILARARTDNRVVVTLDADFHTLLALSGAPRPSVVRIRLEGLRAEGLVELLAVVLGRCEEQLRAGAAVSIQPTRTRVRRLPIHAR